MASQSGGTGMTTTLKRLPNYVVWPRFGADDGYAVKVDGTVVGYVIRHVQWDTGASRGGRRWVLWTAHGPDGKNYDPNGAESTRRDAVAIVLRRADDQLDARSVVTDGDR